MNEKDIVLKGVSKSYGDNVVISNFTHTFAYKSKTAILGTSGRGKTTLLRLICGLEKCDSGSIDAPTKISYVFQENRLFPASKVIDNIKCVIKDKNIADKISLELLSAVGLEGCADMLPSELSGGMKQRVAIARALACDADVYLLDEPFKGLDENLRENIISLVKERTNDKTLILVTHDRYEAEALGATSLIL